MAGVVIKGVESKIVMFLSLLTLFLLVGLPLIKPMLADKTPPIVAFTKVEPLNSPISSNAPLLVRIYRKKVRNDCPVTSERWATNRDGVVFNLPDGSWRGGDAELNYLDFAYPMPQSMPEGEYDLHVHLIYKCPHVAQPFEYDQPPTRFRILNEG